MVGDDDQSIYEFQGARIRNILDFYQRYKETIKVIVLPHNYRSSQLILDKAMATIDNNCLLYTSFWHKDRLHIAQWI